jgi:hypothetical protein
LWGGQDGVPDSLRRRERLSVKAAIRLEDVAPGPNDPIRVSERVALEIARHLRLDVARKAAVENVGDFVCCIETHAHKRVPKPRIERIPGLNRHRTVAEIVRKLCDVGAAVRIELFELLEGPKAP